MRGLLAAPPAAHPLVRALVYGGVLLLLVATWLFLPTGEGDPRDLDPAVRVCLVDASASVRRARPRRWLPWVRARLVEESRAADLAGQEIAVVVFAAGVRVRFGPGAPAALRDEIGGRQRPPFAPAEGVESDGASELERALVVTRSLVLDPARRRGEIVLLGDGTFTGADPGSLRAELVGAGVLLRPEAPPPRERGDLAVRAVHLPATAESGAPLRAVAEYEWFPGETRDERALLAIELESGGTVTLDLVPLELPREGGRRRVALDLGPAADGRNVLRVRAVLEPGPDPIHENDLAHATCFVEGERVVGVVAAESALVAAREWLAPSGTSTLPGLQMHFLPPEELAGMLSELDVLVTYDFPLARLAEPLVDLFVRGGGGWLATSGWGFRTDWTPGLDLEGLHRLLPAFPAPVGQGPRDVVLLMDGSGSMSGEPFETLRAACLDLVGASLPSDRVSLRFFTGALDSEQVIKDRHDLDDEQGDQAAEAARRLLQARVPGGRTFLFDSLLQFAAERERNGLDCLALLLTDGRETDALSREAMDERAEEVKRRLRAADTELVVIGVGEGIDEEILRSLGRPGEAVTRAEELADLQAIFRREIAGAHVREEEAIPVLVAPLPPPAVASLAREALGGLVEDPPPVAICLRDMVRDAAEAVWVTDEGEPILSVQRVGAGRTALFSSSPHGEWAPRWTRRFGSGEPRHFAPILRWLARGRGTRGRERARLEAGALVIEGLDDAWPAELRADLFESTGSWSGDEKEAGISILLAPPAFTPGLDPRTMRRGVLPAGFRDRFPAGALAVRLAALDPDRSADSGTSIGPLLLALPLGPTPEFAGEARRIAFASPPATEGGDSILVASGGTPREGRARAAAPLLALLGLLALFGGALGRRWGGRIGRIAGADGQGESIDGR